MSRADHLAYSIKVVTHVHPLSRPTTCPNKAFSHNWQLCTQHFYSMTQVLDVLRLMRLSYRKISQKAQNREIPLTPDIW
jgi:hypothetical protein